MSAPLPKKLPIDDELEPEVQEKPKKAALVPLKKATKQPINQDVEPEGAVMEKPKRVAKKVPPKKAPTKSKNPANYIEHDV